MTAETGPQRLRGSGERGLAVVEDRIFGWRHRVFTAGIHELDELEVEGGNRPFGVHYQPVRVGHLRRILNRLPIVPGRHDFVDLGCGKGRVLFVAASLGYRRVSGVEFAADLVAMAEANNAMSARRHQGSPIDIVHRDAVDLSFSGEPTVYYAYNPFGAEVLGPVLDNIASARATATSSSWFVYTNPVASELVDAMAGAQRRFGLSWAGERSQVWELPPPR